MGVRRNGVTSDKRDGQGRPGCQSITLTILVTCHLSLVTAVEPAQVEHREGLTMVHLSGTPYEMGRQHGEALRQEIQASVRRVLGYFRRYVKIPWLGPALVNWWLDDPWRQALPFIPPAYLEELRGVADGSGVPLQELYRLHAIPDRMYSCSSFAVWGRATAGGRLIHMRNLDWNIQAGIQDSAVVFIVHPRGKHAFVNIGWAGFVGVLTGINDAQLSVGQIGAETLDVTFRGEPMTFVMRRVLEEADNVDEALKIVQQARRTVGVNYVFADAKARRAIAIESTHRYLHVFAADDPAEHRVGYARPLADVVFRADTAMDPTIRDRQLASDGDPRTPGLEAPGGSAYDVRYLGQAAGIMAHYGRLDPAAAQAIARAVAPSSNVQSVVFAWPDAWIANAEEMKPAAQTSYHPVNLSQLFQLSN